jgi:hypothetical protein
MDNATMVSYTGSVMKAAPIKSKLSHVIYELKRLKRRLKGAKASPPTDRAVWRRA